MQPARLLLALTAIAAWFSAMSESKLGSNPFGCFEALLREGSQLVWTPSGA